MWEIVRKNKIKSLIALTIMTIWYCAIYGIICSFFTYCFVCKFCGDNFGNSIDFKIYYAIGIIISAIILFFALCDKAAEPYAFPKYELKKSTKEKNRKLHNILEEMSIASGLKATPQIYILDSNILNAYACGLTPEMSSLVVSKGLLKALSRDELQGVIAHEVGHIVNRDITYLLCSGIMYSISSACTNDFFEEAKRGERGAAGALIIALISLLGQVICFILLMFVSRKREYIADASACIYTRYPKGLANALLKIQRSYDTTKSHVLQKEATDSADYLLKLSFIFPIKKQNDNIFSTHPSTQNRIKLLLNMKNADAIEYERNFRNLNGGKLLPKNVIKKSKKIKIRNSAEKVVSPNIVSACALNNITVDKTQVQIIKENKDLLEENIKKHREIEDIVHDLADFTIIDCDCGTKLKIPPVYRNTIVICPHCKKRHAIK